MRSYLILTKYKLSLTVALSAAVGYFLYQPDPGLILLYTILGVFLMAGGSAALNQYQEREWDRLMSRTLERPIPAGKIKPNIARTIAILLIGAGTLVLFLAGIIPAILGLANVFFYNFLYTRLKRKTIFAILPGGLVGAIPPLIGWTAAGGAITHPNILYLITIMFLWQIPHFWLLLIHHGSDYEKAGFQSITKYLDRKQISRLVFFWIILSSLFIAAYPLFQIELRPALAILLVVLNVAAISLFYYVLFRQKNGNTRIAFIVTNIFLGLILIILLLNSLT